MVLILYVIKQINFKSSIVPFGNHIHVDLRRVDLHLHMKAMNKITQEPPKKIKRRRRRNKRKKPTRLGQREVRYIKHNYYYTIYNVYYTLIYYIYAYAHI